jgi:hypothetical protein
MPSAAYFRRQADICLRLSLIASDDAISARLVTMAKEYLATSEALEREPGPATPDLVAGDASPDAAADADPSVFDIPVSVSGSPRES